jgi:DNA-binding NarL/FixJ family response regulator
MAAELVEHVRTTILDSNDLTLKGIEAAFASDPRFMVTAASTRVAAPESIEARLRKIDVVLVDPFVGGSPSPGCIPYLLQTCPNVAIYSSHFEPQFFLSALLAGVRGYISKGGSNDSKRLLDLVWTIVKDKALVVDLQYADYFWSRPDERIVLFAPSDETSALTPREREIVQLLGAGPTDGEIALRFRLALSTVQTHVQNIERKLRARSRFDLAVRAIRSGLINPSAMQRG